MAVHTVFHLNLPNTVRDRDILFLLQYKDKDNEAKMVSEAQINVSLFMRVKAT